MTLLGEFVRDHNSKHELERLANLVNHARKVGLVIIGDFRNSSITMKPCVEYMRNLFMNTGINVEIHNGRNCPKTKKVIVVFANIWAIYKWKGPKMGPWIALQTEHLNYRLGAERYYKQFLRRCDQVWDFGFRYFSGTKTIYFPHMFYSSRFWFPSISTNCPVDVAMAGKKDQRRRQVFSQLGGFNRTMFNDLNTVQTIQVFRNVKIAPMIPRQNGNFELHRFASLIAAGCCIICVAPSKENASIAKLFGEAVVFVPFEDMVKTIKMYLDAPTLIEHQKQKALDWFKAQHVEHLLKEVLEKPVEEEKKDSASGVAISNASGISNPSHSPHHNPPTVLPPSESGESSETQLEKPSLPTPSESQ